MRLFACLLFLFLILKSILGMDIAMIMGSDCCSSDMLTAEASVQSHQDSNEENKGSCDSDCHCLCCAQVLHEDSGIAIRELETNPSDHVPSMEDQHYSLLLQKLFWHPPRPNQ